jgi:hypothetical protein
MWQHLNCTPLFAEGKQVAKRLLTCTAKDRVPFGYQGAVLMRSRSSIGRLRG